MLGLAMLNTTHPEHYRCSSLHSERSISEVRNVKSCNEQFFEVIVMGIPVADKIL